METINFEQILRNGIFARAQHSDAYSRDGVVNSCGDLSPIQSIFPWAFKRLSSLDQQQAQGTRELKLVIDLKRQFTPKAWVKRLDYRSLLIDGCD